MEVTIRTEILTELLQKAGWFEDADYHIAITCINKAVELSRKAVSHERKTISISGQES